MRVQNFSVPPQEVLNSLFLWIFNHSSFTFILRSHFVFPDSLQGQCHGVCECNHVLQGFNNIIYHGFKPTIFYIFWWSYNHDGLCHVGKVWSWWSRWRMPCARSATSTTTPAPPKRLLRPHSGRWRWRWSQWRPSLSLIVLLPSIRYICLYNLQCLFEIKLCPEYVPHAVCFKTGKNTISNPTFNLNHWMFKILSCHQSILSECDRAS